MRIGYKISWLVVGTALAATATLTVVGYTTARRQFYAGIDRQLTAVAAGVPRVIGDGYLDRALSQKELPPDEYNALVATLNDLADRSQVYYVYAFAREGDAILNLTTSASPVERSAGDWAAFREPYQEPPQELIDTFADSKTRFAEYTDEFGSFRSIFVHQTSRSGSPYVVGVDVTLTHIQQELADLVLRYLMVGGAVALMAGAVGIFIARRIARPLLDLSQGVDDWSKRDFAPDPQLRSRLVAMAGAHRDEAGELSQRFVDVQDRLQTYLHQLTETTAAKQKIEHQLEIAKTIQEGLLPAKMPKIANFEISGWSKPADQTGGDYFDWLELTNGDVILTIGDVTGHGIGPALVTAASRAYARATFNAEQALDAAVVRLNELLHGDLKGERFVTLVACLLDPNLRQMKLVAAGHGPIMFFSNRRDAVDVIIDSQGMPLGIESKAEYDRPIEMQFEAGDAMVIVSDGFFEWMNSGGETFGIERLQASVLASCRAAQTQIVERLRSDVAKFHGGTSQADDTTALIIRCVS